MAEWYEKYNQMGDVAPKAPTQKKNAKKKDKSFLTDQISTGGGIVGALSGAAGGAAIGSVVPVVGTAVGGILGAILGGGLGSAGGEVAENAIMGEEDLGKNVLQEGLIGGVTSLPIGAGIKLARAGVKATTGAGKTSARELVEQAGAQTVGKKTAAKYGFNATPESKASLVMGNQELEGSAFNASRTAGGATINKNRVEILDSSLPGKLKNTGNRALLAQYGTISKPFARSTDPANTIATIADAGITKPVDAERIAGGITGSSGILTRATSDAVGGAGGVNIDSVKQVFNDAIENYGLVDKDAASLRKVFDAQMNRLRGGSKGSVATTVNPTEVLDVMRALEKRAANLSGKGDNYRLSTPERMDQANVLKLVRDELESSLYEGAGANANLPQILTPKLREELIGLMPDNPQWARYVDGNVMGAKSVGDLRSAAAPFVRVGKIIDEGEQNALTFGGRVGNAFAGGGGGFWSMVGEAVTGAIRNPALNVAGRTMRAASRLTSEMPGSAAANVGQGVLPLTARQAIPRMLMGGEAQAPTNEMSLQDVLAMEQSMGAEQSALQEGLTNPTGYSSQELAGALMQAYAAGDKASADVLQQMFELASQYEQSGASELSANQRTSLATSGNAINTLDQLESLFGGAGGGSGKIGGSLVNLMAGAGLNGGAQTYNDLAASSVSQLAKAINGGGQVSDADAAVLVKALPQVTDSPEVARAKFQALRQRLQVAQQNTLAYGSGGTDLESVLAGY